MKLELINREKTSYSWNNTYNAYAIHTDDDIVGDRALGKSSNIHYLKDLISLSQQSCFIICLDSPQIGLTMIMNMSIKSLYLLPILA